MVLRSHLITIKGKGKHLFEDTRTRIRRYRLSRGSGRTEEIFGMRQTTKVLLAIIVILALLLAFYLVKTLNLQEKAVGEQAEKTVDAAIPVEAQAPESASSAEEPVATPPEPVSEPPAVIPTIVSGTFIIDEKEINEAAKLTVLPEPVDVQNLGAACQVDIRNQEQDIAAAAQFFTKAKRSYTDALQALRDPSETLQESIEELYAEKATLEKKVQGCFSGNVPEQELSPSEGPEKSESSDDEQAAS